MTGDGVPHSVSHDSAWNSCITFTIVFEVKSISSPDASTNRDDIIVSPGRYTGAGNTGLFGGEDDNGDCWSERRRRHRLLASRGK